MFGDLLKDIEVVEADLNNAESIRKAVEGNFHDFVVFLIVWSGFVCVSPVVRMQTAVGQSEKRSGSSFLSVAHLIRPGHEKSCFDPSTMKKMEQEKALSIPQ